MTTREQIIAAAKEAGIRKRLHPAGTNEMWCMEDDAVRFYEIAFKTGAASRDAEIADLKRELDNEQARDIHSCHKNCTREGCVNRRLRAELVNALAACKAKDEALRAANHSCIEDWPLLREALAIQPDDAALKAWLGEPVAEVDDSGVVIVCRYDYKPKDKFYSPKGLK